MKVDLATALTAIRAKAGSTTNPAYRRKLERFLRLVDWALDGET